MTGFGVFVQIDEPFVEGLVRIDALSDDYYIFDEPACRLVGRRSGQAFALGDAVKVEVQSVSVVRRKIDFALADHVARQPRARPAARGDKRAARPEAASAATARRASTRARATRQARGPLANADAAGQPRQSR